MRIGTIPLLRGIQRRIRTARLGMLIEELDPRPDWRILDIGGTWPTWCLPPLAGFSCTLLNLRCPPVPGPCRDRLTPVAGDATDLPFDEGSFDLCFSNSVIEHVGTYENQERFAREARRVARRLWVQTPAREFFIEPHYMTPFVHWLPGPPRANVIRWLTVWGILGRPSPSAVAGRIAELRLLDRGEMAALFPDCEILAETYLGMTKSHIAIRRDA